MKLPGFVLVVNCLGVKPKNPEICTADEVVKAIEQFWVQYHGLPNVVRCDPEGSFRSTF